MNSRFTMNGPSSLTAAVKRLYHNSRSRHLPVNTADKKYGDACAFRRNGVRSYIFYEWAELINELRATTAAAASKMGQLHHHHCSS